MAYWRPVFEGSDGDRPAKLLAYDDGGFTRGFKVVTTYGKDQIIAEGVATIRLPVCADEEMKLEDDTPAGLKQQMLENDFSMQIANEVERLALATLLGA
jgi:hypothetical protein